jgi:hypothetical protein
MNGPANDVLRHVAHKLSRDTYKFDLIYTYKKGTAFPVLFSRNPPMLDSIMCVYLVPNFAKTGKYVWQVQIEIRDIKKGMAFTAPIFTKLAIA